MSKIKNKINISTLKVYAVRLRANSQLPFYLYYLISQLTPQTDIKIVALLSRLSEDLMRLKGYYKKYPNAEKSANELLRKQIVYENNTYKILEKGD